MRSDMTAQAFAGVRGRAHEIRVGSVFSPLMFVVFLYAPLLLLYAVSSKDVFATDFDSRKALSWTAFAYFALALLCFAAGAKLGGDSVRSRLARRVDTERAAPPAQRRSLEVLLEIALVVSIGASVLWFTLGIVRAGGITQFFEIWQRDPLRVKFELLATVPGVTTLVQLAVAAVPLAIAFGLYRRGSVLRVLVVLALVLAAARAVFFSERLALVELLLPIIFLAVAPRKVTVPRVAIYALALLVGVMMFFAATELRRSYAYTNDFSAGKASTRFFGYYLTSVNNGMAVVDEYPAETPFHSTGEFFWSFPGVGDLRLEQLPTIGTVSFRYVDVFGVDPERFWPQAFAAQGLDYEFNVFTAPGYLAADLGWAGLIGVFALGLISGRLYQRSASSPFHRALYAVWLVGLFEFMRIFYFAETRVFPAYLVFIAAYMVERRYTTTGSRRVATAATEPRHAADPA